MKILCVFGQHNYGDPRRGEGYEYSNFLPALRALGHEVHFFESWNRDCYSGFETLNRALLESVEQLRPDVLFCVLLGYEVWLETLHMVRDSGTAILNWGTDDSWKYPQFSRYVAAETDLWASTSHEAWRTAHDAGLGQFELTQWAASGSRTHEPLPAGQCRHAVSFVGSAYGNRMEWVERLARHDIAVECFGQGWPSGPVAAEQIPTIYRESVVSLNFGDSGLQWRGLRAYRSRQIKARVFEVPAAGGCLLTETADHLGDYYRTGTEIEIFAGEEELVSRIRALLDNPEKRDAMAWAGYRRTMAEHLYEARFVALLEKCRAKRRAHAPMDFERFAAVAASHHVSASLRGLRAVWVLPFRLIWGAQRGPRAARRALFELYWRLCGARTYSARGLPGRLFYQES